MLELASVIVPVYNGQKYIVNCLKNLINQTYQNIEIIIVNDGSTDKTLSLCEEEKRNNPQKEICIISQENKGVSAARNAGINRANGKYLFFFDADDFEEPLLIQTCIEQMEKNALDLLITGYYFEVPNMQKNRIESIENSYPDMLYESKESLHKDLVELWDKGMMYNIWNKVFRKRIVDYYHVRFPVGKVFNEDRDFVRDYLRYCNRIKVQKKGYYHYLRDEATATGVYRPNLYDIRKEEYFRLKAYFEEFGVNGKEAEEYLARQHIERVIGCVENLFHVSDENGSKRNRKYIKIHIKNMVDDPLTRDTLKKAKPKSKKMKIMMVPYKWKSVNGIYYMTKFIHEISVKYPDLFHRLRQAR